MKAACGLLALLMLAACSSSNSTASGDPVKNREEAAMGPIKSEYKPVIQSFDANGTRLDVFVDADQLQSMDEPVEDQMKADLLAHWRSAWKAQHSGAHGKLTVRLRNYYGETIFSESSSK